jgi:hypothetical protein
MNGKKYVDKILPNQEFFRYLYHDSASFEGALHGLLSSYASDFDASKFDLITPTNVDFEEMSTPPGQLALLDTIIHLTGVKTVLEIGSFIGNSAMQFARMVGKDGQKVLRSSPRALLPQTYIGPGASQAILDYSFVITSFRLVPVLHNHGYGPGSRI